MHLTNSSVQKAACGPGQPPLPAFLAEAQPYGGSKMSLTRLAQLLAQQGVPWAPLWSKIADVLTACLFAAQARAHVLLGAAWSRDWRWHPGA